MADFCSQVRLDDTLQDTAIERELPDIPCRKVFFICIRIKWIAHSENECAAIVGDFDVADSGQTLGQFAGDVDRFGTRRGAIPIEKVCAEIERNLLA